MLVSAIKVHIVRTIICAIAGLAYYGIKNYDAMKYDGETIGTAIFYIEEDKELRENPFGGFDTVRYYKPYYTYWVGDEEYLLIDEENLTRDFNTIGFQRKIRYNTKNPQESCTVVSYPKKLVIVGSFVLFPSVTFIIPFFMITVYFDIRKIITNYWNSRKALKR